MNTIDAVISWKAQLSYHVTDDDDVCLLIRDVIFLQ